MSASRRTVDLDVFARERAEVPPPRRSPARVVVPLVIIALFLAVLWWSADRFLEDAVSVTVVRPVAGEAAPAAGRPIFQAAGWIAPEPFPIRVPALADGVVAELLAREADVVTADQVVARLVDEDAVLALAAAEAALRTAQAGLRGAEASLATATDALEAAIELEESRRVAEARLRLLDAEETMRAAKLEKAEALLGVAEAELETQRFLKDEGVEGPWQIRLAEARLAEARAEVALDAASLAGIGPERDEARARLARIQRDLDTRFEERLRVRKAEAERDAARAAVTAAETARSEAALRLARMEVRAPIAGVVMERLAMPGSAVGPGAGEGVLTLYDPASLRVRVDVPQDRVAAISPGMAAEVVLDARRQRPYRGEVTRIVHEADIQKTTLEVQVRILDADGLPRPEMLAQVRFLAPEALAARDGVEALVLPARVVRDGTVWVVDGLDDRARRRTVQVTPLDDQRVAVTAGIDLSDKVIDEGADLLEEGDAVEVRNR